MLMSIIKKEVLEALIACAFSLSHFSVSFSFLLGYT